MIDDVLGVDAAAFCLSVLSLARPWAAHGVVSGRLASTVWLTLP